MQGPRAVNSGDGRDGGDVVGQSEEDQVVKASDAEQLAGGGSACVGGSVPRDFLVIGAPQIGS